jgi:hypothetical protein
MIVLREYEDFYNTHRPHRAAPPRQYRKLLPTWASSGSGRVTAQSTSSANIAW